MYCKECGKQISDQAKFCNFCGAKVTAAQPAQSAQPAQAAQTTAQQPAKPKKKSYIGIIIVIILIILAAIGRSSERRLQEGGDLSFGSNSGISQPVVAYAADHDSSVQA